MSLIPEGEFIMGSNEKDQEEKGIEYGIPVPLYKDEYPQHKVNVKAFYIDQYEVTNFQYKKFVDATNRRPPENWKGDTYPQIKKNHPVVLVDWYDASEYCKWAGKRLPTEEEWEKAARGKDGLIYPWGNEFDPNKANIFTSVKNSGDTLPVGSFKGGKSAYNIYDMVGNVWEWTDNWYESYEGNDDKDNVDYGMMFKVTRGQSYMGIGHFPADLGKEIAKVLVRASSRFYDYPTSKQPDLGFRCAKSG